jgi:hypothetical protein
MNALHPGPTGGGGVLPEASRDARLPSGAEHRLRSKPAFADDTVSDADAVMRGDKQSFVALRLGNRQATPSD